MGLLFPFAGQLIRFDELTGQCAGRDCRNKHDKKREDVCAVIHLERKQRFRKKEVKGQDGHDRGGDPIGIAFCKSRGEQHGKDVKYDDVDFREPQMLDQKRHQRREDIQGNGDQELHDDSGFFLICPNHFISPLLSLTKAFGMVPMDSSGISLGKSGFHFLFCPNCIHSPEIVQYGAA